MVQVLCACTHALWRLDADGSTAADEQDAQNMENMEVIAQEVSAPIDPAPAVATKDEWNAVADMLHMVASVFLVFFYVSFMIVWLR
jgi:hypothetical protein